LQGLTTPTNVQVDERIEYDLHEPLQRLASRSSHASLISALQALLAVERGPSNGTILAPVTVPQNLSTARLAYLLGLAHLHLCRALLAPQPDTGDLMPLAAIMAQLQVRERAAPGGAGAVMVCVCAAHPS
jgi:hypothetical protein